MVVTWVGQESKQGTELVMVYWQTICIGEGGHATGTEAGGMGADTGIGAVEEGAGIMAELGSAASGSLASIEHTLEVLWPRSDIAYP
jgi:hypothetical protein